MGNDEGLYNLARECQDYDDYRTQLREMGVEKTGDGVDLWDDKLDTDELDEAVWNLKGGVIHDDHEYYIKFDFYGNDPESEFSGVNDHFKGESSMWVGIKVMGEGLADALSEIQASEYVGDDISIQDKDAGEFIADSWDEVYDVEDWDVVY